MCFLMVIRHFVYLFTSWWTRRLFVYNKGATLNNVVNVVFKCVYKHVFNSLHYIPRVELLDHMVTL